MVIALPLVRSDPPVGQVIAEVGEVVSVDAVAGTKPRLQRSGLNAHVSKEIYCCLLHIRIRTRIGETKRIVVIAVQTP